MIDTLFAALDLPASACTDRRIAKALLIDHGATGEGDRKAIETGIERLLWRATLKPATVGVAAYADDVRDFAEIAVLTLETRGPASVARLAAIVHRAVPYPVVLIAGTADAATLSLAPKRRHERITDAVVVDRLVAAPPVTAPPDAVATAFLTALAVARLPAATLWSLYEGMIDIVETYTAARITGGFRLPAGADEALRRRAALAAFDGAVRDVARLRSAATAEKRLAARIDLAHAVAAAEAAVRDLTAALA